MPKKITKSQRRKIERAQQKRGSKMGRRVWVDVTQQPTKKRSGVYQGFATFQWQKDQKEEKHSVPVNVGKAPARLQIKGKDLVVNPKDGEPYVWSQKDDSEEKKEETGADRRKAAERALSEKVLESDIAKDALSELKKGDSKAAMKIVKQLDDALGKNNEASKALLEKIKQAKEPKAKEPEPEKAEEPRPKTKKKPKPEDKPEPKADEKPEPKEKPKPPKPKKKPQPNFTSLEKRFLKSAPVKRALAAIKKGDWRSVEEAREVLEKVNSRLGEDNQVSELIRQRLKKADAKLKEYETKLAESGPAKNASRLLKDKLPGAHKATEALIDDLIERIGPKSSVVKYYQEALEKSRAAVGGQFEDYNSWKERLKKEGMWDEKRGEPKKDYVGASVAASVPLAEDLRAALKDSYKGTLNSAVERICYDLAKCVTSAAPKSEPGSKNLRFLVSKDGQRCEVQCNGTYRDGLWSAQIEIEDSDHESDEISDEDHWSRCLQWCEKAMEEMGSEGASRDLKQRMMGAKALSGIAKRMIPALCQIYKEEHGEMPDLRPLSVGVSRALIRKGKIGRHDRPSPSCPYSVISIHPEAVKDPDYLVEVLKHELIHFVLGEEKLEKSHGPKFEEMAEEAELPEKYRD